MLNLVASGGAAVSAYFSWKQTDVAIDAVNITSRNQAFSEYLSAVDDVCKVSLVPQDQDDLWTFLAGPDSYRSPNMDPFEIREIYIDHLENRTDAQIDAFLAEGAKKEATMMEKWTQLLIWIDVEQRQDLSPQIPDFSRTFVDDDKRPAAFFAVEHQRRCRILSDTFIDLYKNPDDELAKKRQYMDVWVIPKTESRKPEDILKEWGREDIIDTLTEKKLWPIPEQ